MKRKLFIIASSKLKRLHRKGKKDEMEGIKLKRAQKTHSGNHRFPSATASSSPFKAFPSTCKAFTVAFTSSIHSFSTNLPPRTDLLSLHGGLVGPVLSRGLGGDTLLSVRVNEEADKEVAALRQSTEQ
jgi:hypothetical protein